MIDIHTLYGKTPYGQNYSFEAVLQGMERFGVDYALISSLKAAYYSGPESEAEVLAVCREHPELLPVVGIDLQNNFSPQETVSQLKSAGFVAARLFTEINHVPLDTPTVPRACRHGGGVPVPAPHRCARRDGIRRLTTHGPANGANHPVGPERL